MTTAESLCQRRPPKGEVTVTDTRRTGRAAGGRPQRVCGVGPRTFVAVWYRGLRLSPFAVAVSETFVSETGPGLPSAIPAGIAQTFVYGTAAEIVKRTCPTRLINVRFTTSVEIFKGSDPFVINVCFAAHAVIVKNPRSLAAWRGAAGGTSSFDGQDACATHPCRVRPPGRDSSSVRPDDERTDQGLCLRDQPEAEGRNHGLQRTPSGAP